MHDQPILSRRRFIGSALAAAVVGGGVIGVVADRLRPAGAAEPDGVADAAAASERAERLRLGYPGAIAFPVVADVPLTVLDNFGGYSTMHGCGGHRGIDIFRSDAEPGQALLACVDGVIVGQRVNAAGQGNAWILQDVNGDIYRYHHLDSFAPGLQEGSRVHVGEVLGTMGSSGNASPSGPHLHFEVRRGSTTGPAVDPVPLLGLPLANVTLRAVGGC